MSPRSRSVASTHLSRASSTDPSDTRERVLSDAGVIHHAGGKRTVTEVEVDEIGPSPRYATTAVTEAMRVAAGRTGGNNRNRTIRRPDREFLCGGWRRISFGR